MAFRCFSGRREAFREAFRGILLLCALCSALGFFTFAKLLTSGEGAWALGASGVLGGFGLNCRSMRNAAKRGGFPWLLMVSHRFSWISGRFRGAWTVF